MPVQIWLHLTMDHQKHKPIPIALVNRLPDGTLAHIDTANPQDAAWMGAFHYAKRIDIYSITYIKYITSY